MQFFLNAIISLFFFHKLLMKIKIFPYQIVKIWFFYAQSEKKNFYTIYGQISWFFLQKQLMKFSFFLKGFGKIGKISSNQLMTFRTPEFWKMFASMGDKLNHCWPECHMLWIPILTYFINVKKKKKPYTFSIYHKLIMISINYKLNIM